MQVNAGRLKGLRATIVGRNEAKQSAILRFLEPGHSERYGVSKNGGCCGTGSPASVTGGTGTDG